MEINVSEKYPHVKNRKTIEKTSHTIFNEVRQFAYILGAREILLIQQSTTTCSLLQGMSKRDFQWDTFMRALALIYNHRVSGI